MAANGERQLRCNCFSTLGLWFVGTSCLAGEDGQLGLVHGRYVRDTVYQKYLKLSLIIKAGRAGKSWNETIFQATAGTTKSREKS